MRRTALAIATALLLGCGESEPPAPAPAAEPAPAPAPAPAPEPAPPPAPPAAGGAPDVAAGAATYATYCSSCHGDTGAGDGPVAAGLDPKPAPHADGSYMNALSDEHLTKVIELGGPSVGKSPLMAPWGGTLSDEQIRDVVAFVRSLAEPPYPGS